MWHLLLLVAVAVARSIGFATKHFLNKLNKTMDETAKLVQEMKSEINRRKSSRALQNLDEFEALDEGYHESDDWNLNYSESHGVSTSEPHQKLSHLLIKHQENQIMELEPELHQAQSNLHEKEADLIELSLLSTVSDDETQALTDPKGTSDNGNNNIDSETWKPNKVRIGNKRSMKPPTKPISSFPPPLMRFLRNNAASRSRGRSRSTSTMFFRKKNNTNIETQEPSSPKVTCMGQVRVKRSVAKRVPSADKRVPSAGVGALTKCQCCCWVPRALLFHRLVKPGFCFPFQCKPVWPNWGFLRRNKRDSKVTSEASSPKTELNFRVRSNPNYDEPERENRVTPSAFVPNTSTTPPRNALLLTQCRSAPGRRFLNEDRGGNLS